MTFIIFDVFFHSLFFFFFFFNDTATTEIYTLSLHDALPICTRSSSPIPVARRRVCSASTSRSATGCAGVPADRLLAEPLALGAGASTRVFHSPHPGQRPVQVSATWPHSWQVKRGSRRAMQPG